MKNLVQYLLAYRHWLASILIILLLAACAAAGGLAGSVRSSEIDAVDLDAGWLTEDGSPQLLSRLSEGAVTLEQSVAALNLEGKSLCMKSVDTFFEVLADGAVIYSYYPSQPTFLGESYGMYVHTVPLPADTQRLTLKLTPIYTDAPPTLLNTVIAKSGEFITQMYQEGYPGFCICLLMLTLGVIMLVIGLFSAQHSNEQPIEFFTLGGFAVLVAVWSVNDTLILQMLTQNPALIRLLNYVTLMFLPYFAVAFVASAANRAKTWFLPVIFGVICVNFLVNILLTLLHISDYFHLVKISQAVIVAALCMAVYLVISAVRRKEVEKRFLRTLLIGIAALALGAVIDLIRFVAKKNVVQMTSGYSRMGSLVFLLLIGLYLIRESNRKQVETSHMLAQLAYTDGLTGLKNRLAFNEAERAMQADPDAQCVIIQLDINNLKLVNDVYGHAEGDRHLGGAAHVIRESVRSIGDCYRTGGDEFIAILSEPADEAAAQDAVRQMEQLSEEYNAKEKPPVPLDIAYGIAAFRAGDGTLEKAEQLADERMYECKRLKKSRRDQ